MAILILARGLHWVEPGLGWIFAKTYKPEPGFTCSGPVQGGLFSAHAGL